MVKRGWLVGWLAGAATLRFETDTDARKISFPSFFQRPDARTEPLPLSLRAAPPPLLLLIPFSCTGFSVSLLLNCRFLPDERAALVPLPLSRRERLINDANKQNERD